MSLFSLLATGILVYVTGHTYLSNDKSSKDNIDLAAKRLIVEQFSKAVEQVGDTKATVVYGGIYSLEKIAASSEDYRWAIIQVLSTFTREVVEIHRVYQMDNVDDKKNVPARKKSISIDSEKRIDNKSQAALEVIVSQPSIKNGSDEGVGKYKSINLSYAILNHTNLKSILSRKIKGEHPETEPSAGANLRYANIKGAFLNYANLEKADLTRADLRYSHLAGSYLKDATLSEANLIGTDFRDMHSYTNLDQIKSACFWDRATYSDFLQKKLSKNQSYPPANQKSCTMIWDVKKFDTSNKSFLDVAK